jgi:hypothetical protein
MAGGVHAIVQDADDDGAALFFAEEDVVGAASKQKVALSNGGCGSAWPGRLAEAVASRSQFKRVFLRLFKSPLSFGVIENVINILGGTGSKKMLRVTLRSLHFDKCIEIELNWVSGFFALDKRLPDGLQFPVLLLQQAQARFDHFVAASIKAIGNLLVDEGVEVFFDLDGHCLPHGRNPVLCLLDGQNIP